MKTLYHFSDIYNFLKGCRDEDKITVQHLADLSNDVGEENDLSEENPALLADMKARWHDWRVEMEDAEYRGPFPPWNEYLRGMHKIGHGPVHHWLMD